ncbi:alpha,alpha-trehalose-phosphate synthase (UDP-forming) [Chthonobacter albigriseus]|uniref:alpha,alpha-trehalose-phosphate synthase (UDP-forming) n=1 Tax=Chthonobacter albigriseus TaxID=1683161 RepID=UPI0015EF91FE|nr:trehalose-6-phosphate synthase [Chthonobacter albigriseus]
MGRVIIVSNRVGPLKDTGKAGGLAVALVDVLRERGGTWFGWSGEISEAGTFSEMKKEGSRSVELATIDIDPTDNAEFYAGYANRTLWPVLHYRLDLAEFSPVFEAGYRRVNQRFADRLRPLIGPDDRIWVHDYHFFHLAAELRAMGVGNPIGFFLHIPFPPVDMISALPRHRDLVRALMAYDVIGLQTDRDRRHLVDYLREEAGGFDHGDGRVEAWGRTSRIHAFPIGIDTEGFHGFAETPEAKRERSRLERHLTGRRQIVGVDRIDYSKGIPHRFRALERFFDDYPDERGTVSLLQVAPPSRGEVDAYADIRRELEHLAGHINGRFADLDWTPIRFITRGFPRRGLAGIYRSSRVALVTPLRDGMNLVAKEYVAAQKHDDPGVLILSRFAGAAETMGEALIVNPYAADEVAAAIKAALDMPLDERRARHFALYRRLLEGDAKTWANNFISALEAVA